ncbi:hypothetical protein EI555_005090 [Monodon monoceros]|uniref:Uncharacterized protein n=1 Tax=Monodon monoceros TaxID=40151 RepID=A0A4V6WP82_MONMO|nr:hypothetical protein EI555_005090 [Monodon monoceros]
MLAAKALAGLQLETNRSICQNYLGNLITIKRGHHLCHSASNSPGSREQEAGAEQMSICRKHSRVRAIFCEENLEVFVPLHSSPDHQGHHMRKRLSSDLEPLKKKVANYISTLKDLLKKLAEKSVMSEGKVLLDVETTHDRKEGDGLPLQYLALQKITQKLKVTLDLETAHPNLSVSEDYKKIGGIREEKAESLSREIYGLSSSPGF